VADDFRDAACIADDHRDSHGHSLKHGVRDSVSIAVGHPSCAENENVGLRKLSLNDVGWNGADELHVLKTEITGQSFEPRKFWPTTYNPIAIATGQLGSQQRECSQDHVNTFLRHETAHREYSKWDIVNQLAILKRKTKLYIVRKMYDALRQ
jgi:hypothetical protein